MSEDRAVSKSFDNLESQGTSTRSVHGGTREDSRGVSFILQIPWPTLLIMSLCFLPLLWILWILLEMSVLMRLQIDFCHITV